MNDRRRPGSSGGPRAASPAVAVGVAIVAAILGFFILKQFGGDNTAKDTGSGTADPNATADSSATTITVLDANGNLVVVDPNVATTPTPVVTQAPLRNTYTVVVANASKKQGAAKGLTTAMQRDGFTALPPTNTLDAVVTPPLAVTRVFYAVNFDAAAKDVAAYIGPGIVPEPLLDPSPVAVESAGAQIVIALGTDWAGLPPTGAAPQVQVGTDPNAATVPSAAGSPNDTTATS